MDRKKGCASWISPINPSSNKALILEAEEEVRKERHYLSPGCCCSAEPSLAHYLSLPYSFRTTLALHSTRGSSHLAYSRLEWGWVQIVNFVLAGVLNPLYAGGLWRRLHPGRAGTWGPLLIGAYGLGLILVGVFRTDPAQGFPPGAIASTGPSWHGAIHALGGLFVFVVLAAALGVFVRLFLEWKERGWAFYCMASAVLLLLFFFGGINSAVLMARFLRLGTLVGWMAASVIAIKLLCTPDTPQHTRDH
jgi:Protein of unknown function (DUF998)